MRIVPAKPIKPGASFTFSVDWNFNISNAKLMSMRMGYEFFKEDKNHLYDILTRYLSPMACPTATPRRMKFWLRRRG